RHVVPSCDGLTHASIVSAAAGESDAELGTVTMSSRPSNESAPPAWPATRVGPPLAVPSFPSPDVSTTVAPLGASNGDAGTRPVGAGVDCGDATPETGRCMSDWISDAVSAWS